VPHPAAALAEVPDRQARELVAARFELHVFEQLMRPALVLDAHGRQAAELGHTAGQPVARALELLEAQKARAGGRLGAGARRGDVREAVGHDRRQLALEPCHLRPQRLSRGALAVLAVDQ